MPYLIYSTGDEKEALELDLSCEITIGRTADNQIRILNDNSVSRKHCLIKIGQTEDDATIEDLGSSNGTSLDGILLGETPAKLKDGCKVSVGNANFIFCTKDFEKYADHALDPITIEINLHPTSHSNEQNVTTNRPVETVRLEKNDFNELHLSQFPNINIDNFHLGKGSEIEGGYRIIRDIASGPRSKTFLAYQKSVDRTVALKFFQIKQDFSLNTAFDSLREELFKVSNITEPRLVHYFDCGIHSKYIYLSMPYLSEGSITDLIRRNGKLPLDQTIDIISTITEILQNTYNEAGLLHLSINPSNIMFNDSGNLSITDYGIKNWKLCFCLRTEVGDIWNRYDSPEILNNQTPTLLSDIYSLGVLFCEMLTGILQTKQPFDPKNIIPSLKVNTEIKEVIRLMTEYSPDMRIQSYESLQKMLKHCQQQLKSQNEPKLKLRAPSPQRKIILKKNAP